MSQTTAPQGSQQANDSPLQTQRVIATIIKNQLDHALDDRDIASLKKASKQLISHASVGLWCGSVIGVALVFRSRGRAALLASKSAAGPTSVSKALFYPAAAVPGAESKSTQLGSNVRFLAKALSYGLLGGFVGTQVGVITGTLAGRKTIQTEGNEERIAFAIRKVSAQLYEQGLIGGGANGQAVSSALTGVAGDRMMDDAPPESFYNSQMVEDTGREGSNTLGSSAPVRSDANTKWDELRKANSAKPSSWDTIRESATKETSSNSSSPPVRIRLSGELPQDMSGNTGDPAFEMTDKEQQRIEFEKLMARERAGNDTSEGRWR